MFFGHYLFCTWQLLNSENRESLLIFWQGDNAFSSELPLEKSPDRKEIGAAI